MRASSPISPGLLRNPLHLLSLGFGSGLAPVAPGTFGTAASILPYLFLARLELHYYMALVLLAFTCGIYICGYTSDTLGTHDHSGIVWDEFVGFWITMIAAPSGWWWIALGFVLFRFFDIVKPWPVKLADTKMKGGFGIMIDDVLAGLYALVCMQLTMYVI